MKLAGDSLVILNATILYKYYPIFADDKKNPIIESNDIIPSEQDTPFSVFAKHIFKIEDNTLIVKEEYLDAYNKVILEIQEKKKPKAPEGEDRKEGKQPKDKFNEIASSKGETIV